MVQAVSIRFGPRKAVQLLRDYRVILESRRRTGKCQPKIAALPKSDDCISVVLAGSGWQRDVLEMILTTKRRLRSTGSTPIHSHTHCV